MEIIRNARKAAGLSQAQLAATLGVSQGAVAQWENGITHPSYGVLKPLADTLGLTLDELIGKGAENASVPDHSADG